MRGGELRTPGERRWGVIPARAGRRPRFGMNRILIVGTSGSGKTTLGRALARHIGVAFIETDALSHGPRWTEVADAELRQRLRAAVRAPGWVVDNGYPRKVGDLVLHEADTIVWLDLWLPICLWRVLRRSLRNLMLGQELWNGNRQTFRRVFWGRDSLLVWTVRTHRRLRATIPDRVNGAPNEPWLVRLRTSGEVQNWYRNQIETPW
jgi:adenylate kinase family enzyme